MARKLDALGQSVENVRDCPAPSDRGKTSASTQAPRVRVRIRPTGAASMTLLTAYPAAMAANQAPRPTCLFKEARVCRWACSSGPSTAAAARTASSHVRTAPSRLARLMMTPSTARTIRRPVHDQASASTDGAAQRGLLDAGQVAAPTGQQPGRDQHGQHDQEG